MRKLREININNILFLDIETAPPQLLFKDVPDNVRKEWIYKFKFRPGAPEEDLSIFEANVYEKYFADLWEKEAGLYPEFSRIICISYGFMDGPNFRLKSSSHLNERDILNDLLTVVDYFWSRNKAFMLCAHNGRGFDFPYMAKRIMFHRLELPAVLDVYGLKPWDITFQLDTLEIWKMGAFQGQGGGLPAIAMHFGLSSPKDDIEGKDVAKCFHNGEIVRITEYCQKDVVTLANVFKCFRGEEPLAEGQIQIVAL